MQYAFTRARPSDQARDNRVPCIVKPLIMNLVFVPDIISSRLLLGQVRERAKVPCIQEPHLM